MDRTILYCLYFYCIICWSCAPDMVTRLLQITRIWEREYISIQSKKYTAIHAKSTPIKCSTFVTGSCDIPIPQSTYRDDRDSKHCDVIEQCWPEHPHAWEVLGYLVAVVGLAYHHNSEACFALNYYRNVSSKCISRHLQTGSFHAYLISCRRVPSARYAIILILHSDTQTKSV